MRSLLPIALLAALACQPATPTQTDLTDQEKAELRALFDSTVASVRAADFATWASRFAEDAIFHPPHGPPLHGRTALQAWGAANPPVEVFSFDNVRVAGSGNMAYGTSGMIIKLRDVPADTGKQLVIFRRDSAGKWWVEAVSFNSNLPLPVPPTTRPPKS